MSRLSVVEQLHADEVDRKRRHDDELHDAILAWIYANPYANVPVRFVGGPRDGEEQIWPNRLTLERHFGGNAPYRLVNPTDAFNGRTTIEIHYTGEWPELCKRCAAKVRKRNAPLAATYAKTLAKRRRPREG